MTAPPPPAIVAPPPSIGPRTDPLSPTDGTTGRTIASAARWRRTSRSNAAHAAQRSRCPRTTPRRGSARVPRRQVAADLGAGRVAGGARAQQALTGLEDERLDLLAAHRQHLRDLGVRVVAHLEEDERGALVVGQAVQIGDEVAQVGALLDGLGEAGDDARVGLLVVGRLVRPAGAQDGQAAVARDRVQPRLERDRRRAVTGQRPVGGREGVLEGVLGLLLAREQVPAEREQPAVMAVVDGLERGGRARR